MRSLPFVVSTANGSRLVARPDTVADGTALAHASAVLLPFRMSAGATIAARERTAPRHRQSVLQPPISQMRARRAVISESQVTLGSWRAASRAPLLRFARERTTVSLGVVRKVVEEATCCRRQEDS